MPALGADMETGQVVQWLVQPGDRVKSGDVVAVVETHKGAIDVECFLDGVIEDLVPLGQALPVGAVLARVREESGTGTAGSGVDLHPPAAATAAALPAAAPVETRPAPAPSAPPPVMPTTPTLAPSPTRKSPPDQTRARVSPAARHLAQSHGLNPDTMAGHGADGAVIRSDVERAIALLATNPAPAAQDSTAPVVRVRPSGFDPAQMRQAIAAAMARSKREIPHYYLEESIDFGPATEWIETFNRNRPPDQRVLPAVLMLKAVALALRAVPQLNGFCVDGHFQPSANIHIGWAIALRGGGLVAPAIHHADQMDLPALMVALRNLVQRARAGGLRSSELTDPTITVTSLGDRGAERVQGVIYPPQVAIVGFGRVVQRPWMVGDTIAVRPIVHCSLAADHRTSDGHLGGQLLTAIAQNLQTPGQL